MKSKEKRDYKITPISLWICVLFPIFESLMNINFGNLTVIIHAVEVILFLGAALFNIVYKRELSVNTSRLYFFSFLAILGLLAGTVTMYTADNFLFIKKIRYYLLPLSIILFLITDQKIFFSNKENYSAIRYNSPIIFYIVINLIGCFLIYMDNDWFIRFTQGSYAEVVRFDRYGYYQYSGVFAWPNLLSYSTGALFILCRLAPVNKIVRYSLILLVLLSVNRSVLIAIIIVIFIEQRKKIFKRFYINLLVVFPALIYFITENMEFISNVLKGIYYEYFGLGQDLSYRGMILKKSYELFTEHLFFGVGIRRISDLGETVRDGDFYIINRIGYYSHSSDTFYVILAEIGIIGALILYLAILKIFLDKSSHMKILIIFVLIYSYSVPSPMTMFATLMSYCLIFAQYLKEEQVKGLVQGELRCYEKNAYINNSFLLSRKGK